MSVSTKKVEKLKEKFKASQEKIYHMNDVIKDKAFHLKHDQARNKAIRVAQSRNKSHHAIMDTDRKNRPSDRDLRCECTRKWIWMYGSTKMFANGSIHTPAMIFRCTNTSSTPARLAIR